MNPAVGPQAPLEELVAALASIGVVVVGDVCLDEYIVGRARRLSREAPVPVLEFLRRFTIPGAAANPALNARALGATTRLVGVIGDDETGRTLLQRLTNLELDTSGLIVDRGRKTTIKTRVLAEGSLRFPQHVVRIDHQERHPIEPGIRQQLIDQVRHSASELDAILVSDYQSGVVGDDLAAAVAEIAGSLGKIATADSQGSLDRFRGYTLVKVNQQEAERYLRVDLVSDGDFRRAGEEILVSLDLTNVVITRGGDGLSLMQSTGDYFHIPAANRTEVFDVTGAGDTVIAVLTLALAAGEAPEPAARLANLAAGLVVRKLGNATVSPSELKAAGEASPQ